MQRVFVFDCNGVMVGNRKGYKNHTSAHAVADSPSRSLYVRIYAAFDAQTSEQKKSRNNLLYTVRHLREGETV
jgi:hypothetical protein